MTIRWVLMVDEAPTVTVRDCLKDTATPHKPCCLPAGHKGTHLPQASPWPKRCAE